MKGDEGSSVKNCFYLVSRDSLFHFLHVKNQLELSWFILLQISTSAVIWLIRNPRFCPCQLSRFMIFRGIFYMIRYYFSNKNHSWGISVRLHIIYQIRGGAALLSDTTMVWQMLMFTDWPLTSWYPDQEESWGHAESWSFLTAHWTADAPLQPVHHDNLQRAVWGQSSAYVYTPGLCWIYSHNLCVLLPAIIYFVAI